MKKILIIALLTATAIPAFSQSFADKLMSRYKVNYGDAVLLGGLARDFGLHDSVIFDMRNRYGYNDNDMLTALTLQRYGRRDRDDIYAMRRKGMGWGQIAHAIGMHPGDFNKARKSGKFGSDRDVYDDMWSNRFDRKGRSSGDVGWARGKGVSYRDAYIADQIARARGSNFKDLVTTFHRAPNWTSVSRAVKATPSKKNDKKGSNDNKAKGKDDKSKDKSKSKGKSKGKGKGGR